VAQQQQQQLLQQPLLPMPSTYVSDDALLVLPSIGDDDLFQETDQLLEHLLELPPVQYAPQQQQQDLLRMLACGTEPDACLLNLLLLP
jgi:hypothetical protein